MNHYTVKMHNLCTWHVAGIVQVSIQLADESDDLQYTNIVFSSIFNEYNYPTST
jgi:hypothetical protein